MLLDSGMQYFRKKKKRNHSDGIDMELSLAYLQNTLK